MREEERGDPRPAEAEDDFDAALRGDEDDGTPGSPLVNDVTNLLNDGKTLFEAEIAFQKTRLAFAANRSKSALLSGLFALAFIHLALIALMVGLVIALSPLVTAWGATAIVVAALLFGAFLLLLKVRNSTRELGEAFENDKQANNRDGSDE